jgi:Fe-Mn family superoxide dismutase
MLSDSFGSFTEFKEQFIIAAKTLFGSGWVWLVQESDGNKLKLRSTRNADTPITDNELPLLVCDVWEHAYYVDVRNSRPEYINNFWRLINWRFVEEQLTSPYSF